MGKVRKNFLYFILAVVLATAFFAHESIVTDYEDLNQATINWESHKEKRTEALEAIKESVKGSQLYTNYEIERIKTDDAYNELLNEYDNLKFLEFKTFQQFMGEFGWAFGLFLYSLINLLLSYSRKRKSLFGEILLHTTIMFISLFFIRWCFKTQDFLEIEYILTNLVVAAALSFVAYLLVKAKEKYLSNLKEVISRLFDYIIFDSKPYIDQNKINDYEVKNVELISEVSEKL